MNEKLIGVIKQAMRPLSERYALQVVQENQEGNYTEVLFSNDTTGLRVALDWSELRPFLTIYELVAGEVPSDALATDAGGTRRRAFDVDDLLIEREALSGPVGKMLPGRDEHAASRLLVEYVQALGSAASDVFSGDFTIFTKLDKVVNEREQRLRNGN